MAAVPVYTMLMTLLTGSNQDFETFWTNPVTVNMPTVYNGSEGVYLRNVVMNGDSRTFLHAEWTQNAFDQIAVLGVNLNGDILWSTEFDFAGTTSDLTSWMTAPKLVYSTAKLPWNQMVLTNDQDYRVRIGPSDNTTLSWFTISTPTHSNGTRIFGARRANQSFAFPEVKHGWQGCWEIANLQQYTFGFSDTTNLEPTMCVDYCHNAIPVYDIAILQEKYQCHCAVYDKTNPPIAEDKMWCFESCPADPGYTCGGWKTTHLGDAHAIPGVPGRLREVSIHNHTHTTTASVHLFDMEDHGVTSVDPLYISGVSIHLASAMSTTFTLYYSKEKCNVVTTMTSLPCDSPQTHPANGDKVDVGIIPVMCLKIVFQTAVTNIELQLFAPEEANYIAVPAVVVAGKNMETVPETTTVPTTTTTPTPTTTTPTPTTTTAAAGPSSTTSRCFCPCNGVVPQVDLTSTELQAKVEEIQKRLAVNVSELSSTVRKLTSAEDKRVSAISIGYVGIALIASVFGSVIFIDSAMLLKDMRLLITNLKEGCCRFNVVRPR